MNANDVIDYVLAEWPGQEKQAGALRNAVGALKALEKLRPVGKLQSNGTLLDKALMYKDVTKAGPSSLFAPGGIPSRNALFGNIKNVGENSLPAIAGKATSVPVDTRFRNLINVTPGASGGRFGGLPGGGGGGADAAQRVLGNSGAGGLLRAVGGRARALGNNAGAAIKALGNSAAGAAKKVVGGTGGAAAKTVGTPAAGGGGGGVGRRFMDGFKRDMQERPGLVAAGLLGTGAAGGGILGNWRGHSTGMEEGIAQGTKDTEKTMMKGFQEQLANLKAKEDSIGFLGRLFGSRVFS